MITMGGASMSGMGIFALACGGLVAVLIATVIGYAAARGVTAPLEHITKTVDKLKSQDFDARTGFTGFDEVGRLGRTLDEMAQAIQGSRAFERQLTIDLAHELRTPLMAMRATLEAMIDGAIPLDDAHLLVVRTEVDRLGRLVDAQFKLSRLENRSLPLDIRSLDLSQLICELVSSFAALADDAQLGLTFDADSDVEVQGDADLLRQATAALVSNAFRYTPEGGTIAVEVRRRGARGVVSVTDTGIGIAPDDLAHVFTKFWRARGASNREQGGLGIGLAMVKEIAGLHDGTVQASSTLGEGARFVLDLPLGGRLRQGSPSAARLANCATARRP
jgi:signal transduction histidine kinase